MLNEKTFDLILIVGSTVQDTRLSVILVYHCRFIVGLLMLNNKINYVLYF